MITIYKQFTFDAAHYLPHVPEDHKCRNLHGHTYLLTVYIEDGVKTPEGWVLDFAEMKQLIKPIIGQLDHTLLNDVPGLANPTAELLAVWLWNKLKLVLPQLKRIELKETPESGVIYEG